MRVLVGDDQQDVLEALRLLLKGAGHRTVTVDSPNALLAAARADEFDLILMDLNYARDTTSGQEGLDLLASLQAQHNAAPVVVMTAWGSIDLAVEAMRRGAADFIQKPWDNTRLLATLDKQAEQGRRARTEMEIARNVQQKLFPRKAAAFADIEYAGRCAPAREVSGDYYDFLDLGRERLGIVLADVSGKGVPAALLMANLQACFRTQTDSGAREPAALVRSVNKLFYESTSPENFATLFFGEYDAAAQRLRYVNCGHLPPLLIGSNGATKRLEPTATVLGAFPDWHCGDGDVDLAPGDTLLLFTDGVTEAESPAGEDFGDARLEAVVKSARSDAPESIIDKVIGAVQNFSAGAQEDDITVVAVQRAAA
jgi:sigma-B regulation protein RsbU (phosphoserine phosphatase)